jgi:hypothetical protein
MPPPLIGTYTPPAVNVGTRVWCGYRRAWCRISSWTDSPIPWPRCQPLKQHGGSGLWVNEDLLRAIRTESAAALMHWFGVSAHAAGNWRKSFGITHTGTPGSKAAYRNASKKGAAGTKAKQRTDAELDARAERSKRLGLRPPARPGGRPWTPRELRLLGRASDAEISARIGRTVDAVRCRRTGLGSATFRDRRRR